MSDLFATISFEFLLTAIVFVLLFYVLIRTKVDTALAVFGALLVFVVTGVIQPKEAFSGFSNEGMLSVGFLYVIAYAVQSTGLMDSWGKWLLGEKPKSVRKTYFRLLIPVAGFSAFMNNTPVVSLFIPIIKTWAKRNHVSASKYLIPLSYATILGGTLTLIGTSTTLVVHGLLISSGFDGFSFFEPGIIGLGYAIFGLMVLMVIGPFSLPDHKEPFVNLGEQTREFVIALKVSEGYQNIGKTIEDAGLRHLQGLFLFQINRGETVISPVSPHESIALGDRLFFTGLPSTIVELQKQPGLDVINDSSINLKQFDSTKSKTFEVVVSNGSRLVGKSVKRSDFRGQFNAVILAIHRHGQRINQKIGDIVLQEGDTLLILAGKGFAKRWYNSKEFLLVSESEEVLSRSFAKTLLILSTVFLMVLSVVLEWLPMVTASAVAVAVLAVSKSVTKDEVIKAVNWNVLIVIAASLGLSNAVQSSGIAAFAATFLQFIAQDFGVFYLILAVVFLAMIATETITNTAAAALLFPIIVELAPLSGLSIHTLALALLFGATSSFATPIGYQTNLMVQGPGNYSFTDYFKIGLPMNAVSAAVATALIYTLTT
jgi:di/tricarboxylate transporter